MQVSPEDNKLHPVHYLSRKTTSTESRYHSYELELLAIVKALEKFRIYLYGIPFKIVTVCNAVKQTIEKPEVSARVGKLVVGLDGYDYL